MSIELKDKLVTLESLGAVYQSEVEDRNAAISAEATARAEAISAETAARTKAIANEVTARNAAIVEAINQAETGAPTKVELVSQMTDPDKNYLYIGEEQGYNSGHIYYLVDGAPVDKGVFGGTNIDNTLTISGQAADAKVTGDKIEGIKEDLSALAGIKDSVKSALLACFAKVAWIDDSGQSCYNALEAAFSNVTYPRITAVYNAPESFILETSANLSDIKQYLTVKYFADETSSGVVLSTDDYELSGQLKLGKNPIMVTYDECRAFVDVDAFSLMIDGYNANNDLNVAATGPYCLYYPNAYTYDHGHPIAKIKIKVNTPGDLSLGVISTSAISDNKISSYETFSVMTRLHLDTAGEQAVTLNEPFTVPDGYYLVIGVGSSGAAAPGIVDTCIWKYGDYSAQKGFVFQAGSSARGLGINVYVGGNLA